MTSAMAVVVCALGLLGRSPQSVAPIVLLDAPPVGASANVEGLIVHGSNAIHLITSTPNFQDALRSHAPCDTVDAVRKIASIIVHEEWHLHHGADERGAYGAQLTALLMLGASGEMQTSVRQSMAAALRDAKRRQRPDLVIARDE